MSEPCIRTYTITANPNQVFTKVSNQPQGKAFDIYWHEKEKDWTSELRIDGDEEYIISVELSEDGLIIRATVKFFQKPAEVFTTLDALIPQGGRFYEQEDIQKIISESKTAKPCPNYSRSACFWG